MVVGKYLPTYLENSFNKSSNSTFHVTSVIFMVFPFGRIPERQDSRFNDCILYHVVE